RAGPRELRGAGRPARREGRGVRAEVPRASDDPHDPHEAGGEQAAARTAEPDARLRVGRREPRSLGDGRARVHERAHASARRRSVVRREAGREARTRSAAQPLMPARIQGKRVLAVGCGQGFGATTARLLAAEGASVVIADVDSEKAEQVAEEIRGAGHDAAAYWVDIGDEEAVERLVDTTVDRLGGIDD